jgi:RNA polymerase sigma-70 factor (ECF subfamily)
MAEDAEPADAVLIRRFVEGDERSFVCLYRRHSPAVYGLLSRLVGPLQSDAGDLLQETWMRAAARLTAFRGDAQFRTWLSGIALNCYREWRRRSDRHPHVELGDAVALTDRDPDPDIARVLEGLPAAFREVLVLHDIEGYTHDEIARLIEIEPGTSKSRLSRARELFRRRWLRPVGADHE